MKNLIKYYKQEIIIVVMAIIAFLGINYIKNIGDNLEIKFSSIAAIFIPFLVLMAYQFSSMAKNRKRKESRIGELLIFIIIILIIFYSLLTIYRSFF